MPTQVFDSTFKIAKTLVEMTIMEQRTNGLPCFCLETLKLYFYNSTAKAWNKYDNADPTLLEKYFFQIKNLFSELTTDEQKATARKNLGIDENKMIFLEEKSYTDLTTYEKDTLYMVYVPIEYTKIAKPTDSKIYYDGSIHKILGTDEYTVTGSGGSAVGVYSFVLTLNTGYEWDDETFDNLTITITIEKEVLSWVFGDAFPIMFSS
jgi:hypothetical protein